MREDGWSAMDVGPAESYFNERPERTLAPLASSSE